MSNPRELAIDALNRIKYEGAYANLLTNELLRKNKFDKQGAAFFTDLVNGTTRYLRYLDYIIEICANRPTEDIEDSLLIVLEISAYSALIRGVQAHAVVNEGVNLARKKIGERAVGFTNGVLRKLVQHPKDYWDNHISKHLTGVSADATKASVPDWIYKVYADQIDNPRELKFLFDTLNSSPEVTILRPPLSDSSSNGVAPGAWSPFALKLINRGGLTKFLEEHRFVVQDEGSQLVSLATTLIPLKDKDNYWLDMTAGPGGKASFMASIAKGRSAHLVTNELHSHRANLISQTLYRLGLGFELSNQDAFTAKWEKKFDRVLLDAPCTGLGALRRRSESRWRKTEADLIQLVDLQKRLLNRAIAATRQGGIVAYTTCSLHPRETEEVVEFALKTSSVEVIDISQILPSVPIQSAPFIKLWPHIHGTDGMFMAALKVG